MLFKEEQAFEGAQRASGEGVEVGMIVCARFPPLLALGAPVPSLLATPRVTWALPMPPGTHCVTSQRGIRLLFHVEAGLDNKACMLKRIKTKCGEIVVHLKK